KDQSKIGQNQSDQNNGDGVQCSPGNSNPQINHPIHQWLREVIRRKCGTQEARQCDCHLNGCQKLGRLSCQTEQAFCSFISLIRHPFQFCFVYGKYRNLCTSKNCI